MVRVEHITMSSTVVVISTNRQMCAWRKINLKDSALIPLYFSYIPNRPEIDKFFCFNIEKGKFSKEVEGVLTWEFLKSLLSKKITLKFSNFMIPSFITSEQQAYSLQNLKIFNLHTLTLVIYLLFFSCSQLSILQRLIIHFVDIIQVPNFSISLKQYDSRAFLSSLESLLEGGSGG